MKKILFVIIFGIFLISLISANLGTFQQSDCVNIKVLANCSNVNITEITVYNYTYVINSPMSKMGGQTFNYTFCNTTILGNYIYSWQNPCVDCSNGDCGNSFEITPSGKSGSSNIVFFIFIILFLYTFSLIGLFGKNEIITLLSGMFLIFLGVYMVRNGIIIYRDDLTNYFSYITAGYGFYIAFLASYSLYEDM